MIPHRLQAQRQPFRVAILAAGAVFVQPVTGFHVASSDRQHFIALEVQASSAAAQPS